MITASRGGNLLCDPVGDTIAIPGTGATRYGNAVLIGNWGGGLMKRRGSGPSKAINRRGGPVNRRRASCRQVALVYERASQSDQFFPSHSGATETRPKIKGLAGKIFCPVSPGNYLNPPA